MPAALYNAITFEAPSRPERRVARPGLFARAARAIHDAQVRRAERDIARFIESRGGRITDDLERRIEHHFV